MHHPERKPDALKAPRHNKARPFLALTLALASLVLFLCPTTSRAAVAFTRTEDVIYGRKPGVALTLDVFRPANTNGFGVVYMVSGGWFSAHEFVNPALFQSLLDRGYTVFAVVHGSQPKYVVTEIVGDIHRAVRFIRHHAAEYGVDPAKLGITGASAGGHLSLTMGTQGTPGKADAKDPVDRESSAVAAVACFFPPTDFLNYGKPGEDAVGVGILKDFKPAFGPRSDTPEGRQALGREISPIYFISSNTVPTLIIHGDADALVPIQQAKTFIDKAREHGINARLVTRTGGQHGWPEILSHVELVADWFDAHIRGLPLKEPPVTVGAK